jgi:hypothetical protein
MLLIDEMDGGFLVANQFIQKLKSVRFTWQQMMPTES